jgi:hypothetical protein
VRHPNRDIREGFSDVVKIVRMPAIAKLALV